LWNQIKADVLGLPILLPEASVGAPFGDALLTGIGLGIYPDILVAAREMVRIKTRCEPDQRTHEIYGEFYSVFRSIYEHLRGDFDQAATFISGTD
jgi:xylulokinase